MESAESQWIGLASVALFAAMVIAPFVFTWIYCDRPEAFLKRCLRATVASLIVIALSAALLLLFFQSHFPDGAVLQKVKDTGTQGLIAACLAPIFGTDFLMRIKVSYKWRKSKGHTEV
jgi:glucan phosphoethanolaminetransferase (alkaline phosphatase superfamily)